MLFFGLCLTLAFVAIIGPATAQSPKLLPGDEASKDPSFQVFRDRLWDAVRHHDQRFLLSVVHPQIKNGFGGDDGIDGFKRIWKPESPSSEIWGILDRLLSLGAASQSPGTFVVPYQFEKFPEKYAGYGYVAVVSKNAKIRTAPNVNAAVIAVVSYDILKRAPGGAQKDPAGWTRVLMPSGRVGYIANRSVYSSVEDRAIFTKTTGRWLMAFFGAGD